jgi:hypothetical protein
VRRHKALEATVLIVVSLLVDATSLIDARNLRGGPRIRSGAPVTHHFGTAFAGNHLGCLRHTQTAVLLPEPATKSLSPQPARLVVDNPKSPFKSLDGRGKSDCALLYDENSIYAFVQN